MVKELSEYCKEWMTPADPTYHYPGDPRVYNKWFSSFQISWIFKVCNPDVLTRRHLIVIYYKMWMWDYVSCYMESLLDVYKHLLYKLYLTGPTLLLNFAKLHKWSLGSLVIHLFENFYWTHEGSQIYLKT